jgi:putative DNA primase/helicase
MPAGDPGGGELAAALELVEPWPAPVEGAELLDELRSTAARYVVLPRGGAEALALWALHTWVHGLFDISPRLALYSPVKRCGKTRALQVLLALVPRPLVASNISPAAIYRSIEAFRPTLLIDEADTFLQGRDDLRGVLNSGHCRAGAFVVRAEPGDGGARFFSTWAPCAVALIGKLPATLEDRSVSLPLQRRAQGEAVERLRAGRLREDLLPLRRRCARWALEISASLLEADPSVPAELDDRAADNWRPLLALADAAGGRWPEEARRAALTLSGARDEREESLELRALAALRAEFERTGASVLSSRQVVGALVRDEEGPWRDLCGRPMSLHRFAAFVRPFDVCPIAVRRSDGSFARAYVLAECAEAFARYLPPSPIATSETT